eukprot:8259582-Pyramimonas_sp.AAC.2
MHVHRQRCQTEGSVYVAVLWIRAATMRGIWGKLQAKEPVFGWCRVWNRTVRMRLAAVATATAFPSVRAY